MSEFGLSDFSVDNLASRFDGTERATDNDGTTYSVDDFGYDNFQRNTENTTGVRPPDDPTEKAEKWGKLGVLGIAGIALLYLLNPVLKIIAALVE